MRSWWVYHPVVNYKEVTSNRAFVLCWLIMLCSQILVHYHIQSNKIPGKTTRFKTTIWKSWHPCDVEFVPVQIIWSSAPKMWINMDRYRKYVGLSTQGPNADRFGYLFRQVSVQRSLPIIDVSPRTVPKYLQDWTMPPTQMLWGCSQKNMLCDIWSF